MPFRLSSPFFSNRRDFFQLLRLAAAVAVLIPRRSILVVPTALHKTWCAKLLKIEKEKRRIIDNRWITSTNDGWHVTHALHAAVPYSRSGKTPGHVPFQGFTHPTLASPYTAAYHLKRGVSYPLPRKTPDGVLLNSARVHPPCPTPPCTITSVGEIMVTKPIDTQVTGKNNSMI